MNAPYDPTQTMGSFPAGPPPPPRQEPPGRWSWLRSHRLLIAILATVLAFGLATTGTAYALTHDTSAAAPAPAPSPTHKVTPTPTPTVTPTPTPTHKIAPAPPAPASLPVLSVTNYTGIRPGMVSFSGDATYVITGITWSDWGANSAHGTGTSIVQGCMPDCADGTQTPYTTTITLSAPYGGHFTHVTAIRADQVISGSTSLIQGAQQDTPAPAPTSTHVCYDQGVVNPDCGSSDVAVVERYYQFLNAKDYDNAWAMGGSHIAEQNGQTYDSWVAGYADTASTVITSDHYAGDGWVAVNIKATTTSGAVHTYTGSYQVSGSSSQEAGVVDAGQLTQTS